MSRSYSDLYFDNSQLLELVQTAELIFGKMYNQLSTEEQTTIDNWLCFKKEFDLCCGLKHSDENDFKSIKNNKSTASLSTSESWCSSDEIHTEDEEENNSDEFNLDFTTSGFDSASASECLLQRSNHNYQNKRMPEKRRKKYDKMDPASLKIDNKISLEEIPDYLCQCCASDVIDCRKNFIIAGEIQIDYLRQIKMKLVNICQNYHRHSKRCNFNCKVDRRLLIIHEIIEIMDTSIELKNDMKILNTQMSKLLDSNNVVYSEFLNFLEFLTAKEIKYLLMWHLNRYVDLNENSDKLDRLILSLDNTIIEKEIKLKHLNDDLCKIHTAVLTLKKKKKLTHSLSDTIQPNTVQGIIASLEAAQKLSVSSAISEKTDSNQNSKPKQIANQKNLQNCDVSKCGNKLIFEK